MDALKWCMVLGRWPFLRTDSVPSMVFSDSYGLGLRKKNGVNLYASGEYTMLHGPLVLIAEPLNLRILRLLSIRNGTVGWYDHWTSTCVGLANVNSLIVR